VLLCGFHLLGATSSSVSDYSIDVWQTEQGLPQDSVTAIVQTRDGYLWLGTYNGLVRFDGVRFKIFDTSNTPELGDSRITSLFEDADGTLWIGHETGGLTQLRAGKFTAVNPGNDWPGGVVFAMGTDADGVLWLLNREGTLLSLQGAKLVAPMLGPVENVPSLAKDKNGELWVVRGRLLGSLKKGRLVPWQSEGTTGHRQCPKGLWEPGWRPVACMGSGGLKKIINQGTIVDWGPVPWGQDSVTALLETKSGDLLVGTLHEGLFLLSPNGTSLHFTRQNGLSHDWVLACARIAKETYGWEPAVAV
jgi:ligand-binding sensor domain-containing protein